MKFSHPVTLKSNQFAKALSSKCIDVAKFCVTYCFSTTLNTSKVIVIVQNVDNNIPSFQYGKIPLKLIIIMAFDIMLLW